MGGGAGGNGGGEMFCFSGSRPDRSWDTIVNNGAVKSRPLAAIKPRHARYHQGGDWRGRGCTPSHSSRSSSPPQPRCQSAHYATGAMDG